MTDLNEQLVRWKKEYGLFHITVSILQENGDPKGQVLKQEKDWVIKTVGEPKDYLAFCGLLQIYLSSFEADLQIERIESDTLSIYFKALLKFLREYLIETEVKRVFGQKFSSYFKSFKMENPLLGDDDCGWDFFEMFMDLLCFQVCSVILYPAIAEKRITKLLQEIWINNKVGEIVSICARYHLNQVDRVKFFEVVKTLHRALTKSNLSLSNRGLIYREPKIMEFLEKLCQDHY